MIVEPVRLQRSRRKGYRLPSPNGLPIVYVGRPTKWGNPYRDGQPDELVRLYRSYLSERPDLIEAAKKELRGKNLACWCPIGSPCHADVLMEVLQQ
jgi:hypothetical protein